MIRYPEAEPFRNPVDPHAMNILDYHQVIKNPMDFKTVQKKLRQKKYTSLNEFTKDIRLIFNNAMVYNPPRNIVHVFASCLLRYFNEKIRLLFGPPINIKTTFNVDNNYNYWNDTYEWLNFGDSINHLSGQNPNEFSNDHCILSFQQKIDLCDKLEQADQEQQYQIFNLLNIKESSDDTTVHIDLQSIDDVTLWKLNNILS
ncbi:Bromodomain containing protein [Entamoeba marina]